MIRAAIGWLLSLFRRRRRWPRFMCQHKTFFQQGREMKQ